MGLGGADGGAATTARLGIPVGTGSPAPIGVSPAGPVGVVAAVAFVSPLGIVIGDFVYWAWKFITHL